jgi:hypothetical protein
VNFKFRELLLIFAVIIMLSVSFGIASVTAEKITEKAKKNCSLPGTQSYG